MTIGGASIPMPPTVPPGMPPVGQSAVPLPAALRDGLAAGSFPTDRWERVARFVGGCPDRLGRAVLLAGSWSVGAAAPSSDVDLVLLVDELPEPAACEDWLRTDAGAQEVRGYDYPTDDGSVWFVFRCDGIWFDCEWRTLADVREQLERIVAGDVVDHYEVNLADVISHGVVLRDGPELAALRTLLDPYPDRVAARLVYEAIDEAWLPPHVSEPRRTARRGSEFAFSGLVRDRVFAILRILFAINAEWEPHFTWVAAVSERLHRRPDSLVDRVEALFAHTTGPLHRSRELLLLARDTMALVPQRFGPEPAAASIAAELSILEDELTGRGRRAADRPRPKESENGLTRWPAHQPEEP